jgi:hypothetical protein
MSERDLMPNSFQELINVMIATMCGLPENRQDVIEAAERCCDHIAQEVITIRYIEQQRKRQNP